MITNNNPQSQDTVNLYQETQPRQNDSAAAKLPHLINHNFCKDQYRCPTLPTTKHRRGCYNMTRIPPQSCRDGETNHGNVRDEGGAVSARASTSLLPYPDAPYRSYISIHCYSHIRLTPLSTFSSCLDCICVMTVPRPGSQDCYGVTRLEGFFGSF